MPNTFECDKRWSDTFIPQIRRIVAEHLILEAPLAEDLRHNTDLIVLQAAATRIACRVRREEYLDRYGDEITVRSKRPGGSGTELQKILDGWGDVLFYGFAGNGQIARWVLGDLDVFRHWYKAEVQRLPPDCPAGIFQSNQDASSQFMAFKLDWLPPEFVIARS